jgi:Flp pilus assembly protein TadD
MEAGGESVRIRCLILEVPTMSQQATRHTRPVARVATALVTLLFALAVQAAGGGGGGGAGGDDGATTPSPEVTQAVDAIKAQRWSDAIAVLTPYVKRVRDDADAQNWLAYAYRKSGQLEPAFEHYRRALAIEPGHLGAHEYLGEAYLQAGQPDKAEEQLRELERLCSKACDQYKDLREAIAAYRNGRASSGVKS